MRALALVSVAVVLAACGSAPRCQATTDCASGQVCAPSGICLTGCTTTDQCAGGQKCSLAGACVSAATGCAVTSDCHAGQVCVSGGQCVQSSTGGAMADAGPASCGGHRYVHQATESNILIVLDQSCSMQETIGNSRTKWDTATAAVRSVTSSNAGNARLRFGLQMFSLAGAQCQPGMVNVPVGTGTVTQISTAMPSVARGSGTPIGAALHVAGNSGQLDDPTRANFVLLLTDGMENCNGAPVAEVQGLFAQGVRTYSVGFGAEVDATNLTEMAIKGGTARATTPRYYQADSAGDLESALNAIASGAASCDFTLTQTPPNPNALYVAVDGQFFPRDPSRVAGWDYQAQGNRVTLYGPACDIVAQRPGAKVSIIYGCPDESLIEVGNGGRLDAGIPGWPSDGGFPEIN